jgi:hypothetical protein
MTTRHEFLAQLHELLRPKVYLEIGVHTGQSLRLAQFSEHAFGVDPNPMVGQPPANSIILPMTSDEFFEKRWFILPPVDLAFIDGMHLFENALVDFHNTEKRMAPGGIIVLDDVLPYNQAIAERVQPPGDWTGDVWKVWYRLSADRPDLEVYQVDTSPTGTMVIMNPDPEYGWDPSEPWEGTDEVPSPILNRSYATQPETMLEIIRERMAANEQLRHQHLPGGEDRPADG